VGVLENRSPAVYCVTIMELWFVGYASALRADQEACASVTIVRNLNSALLILVKMACKSCVPAGGHVMSVTNVYVNLNQLLIVPMLELPVIVAMLAL